MISPIPPTIWKRMQGVSYPADCPLPIEELRYIEVPFMGFDGKKEKGELIANVKIAESLIAIFDELFQQSYPIEKMKLIDDYLGDDEASMSDNNTSCFNYRLVDGVNQLSKHAYGLAVDVNPLYNPYVRRGFGDRNVLPLNAICYKDRSVDCPYYIRQNDVCYNIFKRYGFRWGGDWEDARDYQHFEI